MSPVALIEFLQSSGLIQAPQAQEIAGQFVPKKIAQHDFLLREGQVSDEYLFLSHGLLRAFARDPDGNDITTSFYKSGQVAFEVSSFFTRVPAQENIQALTDCTGWCISFTQLNTLFHTRPEFREFGRLMLVQGYAALKGRMLSMITESATARYEQLVKTTPEILLNAPVKHIASYLGVTDTSLSRIRAAVKGAAHD
jgi:CRP-like cAMP-binding protein